MYLKYYVFLYFLNILLHKLIKINKRHNSLWYGILLKEKILVYCIITLKILDQPQNSYDRYRAPYKTLYIYYFVCMRLWRRKHAVINPVKLVVVIGYGARETVTTTITIII